MQVKSIAECSKGSIAILSIFIKLPFVNKIFVLSLRSLFCLFLSGRLRQVSVSFFLNNVDPDQLASEKPVDEDPQDFRCFQILANSGI